jgi:hypothetical protein
MTNVKMLIELQVKNKQKKYKLLMGQGFYTSVTVTFDLMTQSKRLLRNHLQVMTIPST